MGRSANVLVILTDFFIPVLMIQLSSEKTQLHGLLTTHILNRLRLLCILPYVSSSRACLFGSQTMREFSEPVSRNRLGQGHR